MVVRSYGGYLSLGLLYDLNIKIDGMFLFVPCVISNRSKRKLPIKPKPIIEQNLNSLKESDADFKDFLDMAVVANKETWQRYKKEVLSGLKKADDNFTSNYQKNGYGFTFEANLKDIQFDKPISVLVGKQDNCVGYEDAWNLLNHLPQLNFIVLNGAGHHLQIEKKDFFNFVLFEWLREIK